MAACPTSFTPLIRPVTRPSTIYLGILSASFIPENHSFIASPASCKYGTTALITPVKSSALVNHSSNLTIASPIDAVTSRMFKLKAPRTCLRILNAVFRTPPTTVEMMWRIENNPLKVRLTLSAVSSLTFSFCENSFIALIML